MSGRRDLWPLFRLSLAISVLAHLLFVLFVPLVPREEPPPPRLQIRLMPLYRQLEPLLPEPPELPRFPGEPPAALSLPYAPGTAATFGFGEGPLDTAPLSSSAGTGVSAALPMPQPKPLQFEPEKLYLPDLDSLALEGLKKAVQDRQHSARLYLPDSDTTDEESQRRHRARQVVERAIQAMGGWEALRAIHEMRARVWIEATENVIRGVPPLYVRPYAYPVATWQYSRRNAFANTPIEVKPSLDLAVPNEAYLLLNPAITKGMYYALFDARWSSVSPQTRKLREQAEAARWHFLERFCGQGIALEYLGVKEFDDTPADVIQVEDAQYGYEYQAMFARRTGLLMATREALTLSEQRWSRDRYKPGAETRVWTTRYGGYQQAQGVLTPHRLERSLVQRGEPPKRVVVHLQIAYNGQEPDPTPPDLEE